MSVQRVFASVWSFVVTLVRSLLALLHTSFRRRASDPFSLPSANRTPNDALARAHAHLRPILLTQRLRTRSATSTLFPAHGDNATAVSTSPKLDPHDAELGLSITACDLLGPPTMSATSSDEGTPDTSHTGSLYVLPLTPPDRCYLAPLPSTTDCPYTEPWPTNGLLDHGKPKLARSSLEASTNTNPAFPEPMVAPIGSPPPGRWDPIEIWTSTPCKNDNPAVPDLAFIACDYQPDPPSALVNISHAIISRSQSSIRPYDDASNSSASSDAGPFGDYPSAATRHRAQARVPRSKNQPFPRFHHPDAYTCAWPRHGGRLPGKRAHAYARSQSHMDLRSSEWYDANAYAPSPLAALSPPRGDGDSATEDEDEMPLGRLRERLARRHAAAGTSVGSRKPPIATAMSPRTRRMSEGCLLALSESTPTRVGVGARSSRHVRSVALDGDGYGVKDWLEALSLQFPCEQNDALTPEPEIGVAVPSVKAVPG